MIISGHYERMKPGRQAVTIFNGDVYGRTDIIAAAKGCDEAPHAYLVEQQPNVALAPHFHLTDQFQVVVAGDGILGRSHALAPATVHYARAKTAYGPIQAGAAGLAYLTLRPRMEYGAHYLADPRTEVDRRAPKLQMTAQAPVPVANIGGVVLCNDSLADEVITPQADGLAVWQLQHAAGSPLSAPALDNLVGRFAVVMDGSLQLDGDQLPPWSCVWLAPSDDIGRLRAGASGVRVLLLQFPRPAFALASLPDHTPGRPALGNE